MSRKIQKTIPESTRKRQPAAAAPTVDKNHDRTSEILAVLTHQLQYIDQLERDNKLYKEELCSFRKRLDEVIKENQHLHGNIRSNVILHTISKASAVATENQKEFIEDEEQYLAEKYYAANEIRQSEQQIRENALGQWRQEMENVKSIYAAKIEGLEAEVKVTKSNLEKALADGNDLRERNQMMEELLKTPKHFPSLASGALQKEQLALNANVPLIERLTKERDDLMKSVASMRNSVRDAQKTESALRQEVQKSLAMVEDVQLEKAQTKLDCERLRKELDLTRKRLDTEISSTQKKVAETASHQRKACQEEMNDLLKKVGEMTAVLASYENSVETAGREKASLTTQLGDARRQLLAANEDLGKMRSEIEHEVRSTIKGYKGAEEELQNTKSRLQQELTKTQQERVRLEQEASEHQRRLTAAQSEALASNELNVTLTQQLNESLHRLQDVKQEKERVEKDLRERLELVESEAEEKETRLEDIIRRSEIEQQQRLSDLESITSKQSNLIRRLKEEGKVLETELKRLTKKYRKEMGVLAQDKEAASARMTRLVAANRELEEQVVQHGITHREMQFRLRELDERSRRTTGFASSIAAENDRLVIDKSMLQSEVEFLQSEVMRPSGTAREEIPERQ